MTVKVIEPLGQPVWLAGWPGMLGAPQAFTLNGLLVPVWLPPVRVAVIVLLVPVAETVTLCVRWPAAKAPETVGLIVPAVVVKLTVPVKLVAVLLNWSCAEMVIGKAAPVPCGLLLVAKPN